MYNTIIVFHLVGTPSLQNDGFNNRKRNLTEMENPFHINAEMLLFIKSKPLLSRNFLVYHTESFLSKCLAILSVFSRKNNRNFNFAYLNFLNVTHF